MAPKRPYATKQRPELEKLVKENWNSSPVLELVSFELGFRQKKASIDLRNKVLERLKELSQQSIDHPNQFPDETELSFLEYLGYSLADTPAERRKVLDLIYSQDLPPGPNSKQWGNPKSATRRLYISEILSSRCKRIRPGSPDEVRRRVAAWRADLKYFTEQHF
jgi:hypothetical protein